MIVCNTNEPPPGLAQTKPEDIKQGMLVRYFNPHHSEWRRGRVESIPANALEGYCIRDLASEATEDCTIDQLVIAEPSPAPQGQAFIDRVDGELEEAEEAARGTVQEILDLKKHEMAVVNAPLNTDESLGELANAIDLNAVAEARGDNTEDGELDEAAEMVLAIEAAREIDAKRIRSTAVAHVTGIPVFDLANSNSADRVRRFAVLDHHKKSLKAAVSLVQDELDVLDDLIQNDWEQSGTKSMKIETPYGTRGVHTREDLYASASDVEVLRGFWPTADFVQPTINAQTLAAWVREESRSDECKEFSAWVNEGLEAGHLGAVNGGIDVVGTPQQSDPDWAFRGERWGWTWGKMLTDVINARTRIDDQGNVILPAAIRDAVTITQKTSVRVTKG